MNSLKNQSPDINLHLFCRAGHRYKNGLKPIVLRITYRTQRRDILTGLSCTKNSWIADRQFPSMAFTKLTAFYTKKKIYK
jgi:hypothetical protein